MKNLKMLIQYDGTDFFGWQSQPAKRTVQDDIELAFKKITNEKIRVIGAGRTDHGAHAIGQVANFFTASRLTAQQLLKAVNNLTGDDIYVKKIERVDRNFHSRYSAKSKVYHYNMIFEPIPSEMRYNWYVRQKLNLAKMERTVPSILGKHNFQKFSYADETENKVCTIKDLRITYEDGHLIIKIEGDRFLRKMVRGIAGFLYDVGRGRFPLRQGAAPFADKIKNIYFAPPQGLCLMEVKY